MLNRATDEINLWETQQSLAGGGRDYWTTRSYQTGFEHPEKNLGID